MSYGPQLPPHLLKLRETSRDNVAEGRDSSKNEENETYGPVLPPSIGPESKHKNETENSSIGPQLPSNFKKSDNISDNQSLSNSDSDDEFVGPLPSLSGSHKKSKRQQQIELDLEKRACDILNKGSINDTAENVPKRESWMLELPAEKAKNFGLGPRQFSKNTESKPKLDRSWTDTPEIKAKRAAMAASGQLQEDEPQYDSKDQDVLEYMASLKRDKEMERVANELRQKRGTDSLVEIHDKEKSKRRKKEIASGNNSNERRPFDRDLDLQANRFDEAAKKAMLKNARKLNDKFSSGNHKYL